MNYLYQRQLANQRVVPEKHAPMPNSTNLIQFSGIALRIVAVKALIFNPAIKKKYITVIANYFGEVQLIFVNIRVPNFP